MVWTCLETRRLCRKEGDGMRGKREEEERRWLDNVKLEKGDCWGRRTPHKSATKKKKKKFVKHSKTCHMKSMFIGY